MWDEELRMFFDVLAKRETCARYSPCKRSTTAAGTLLESWIPSATLDAPDLTGGIGALCVLPLRAIIRLCVVFRIHPNTLTLLGGIINIGAAWALAHDSLRPGRRGHHRGEHLRFHRRQVAHELQLRRRSARSGIRRSIACPILPC